MNGRFGVWHLLLSKAPADVVRQAAAEIEELGYGTLWVYEGVGAREPLTGAGLLLAATRRIAVGTGIASIWSRDATAMAAASATLAEAYPGRFVLGIGVSHSPLVSLRGHAYNKPLTAMRAYLDDMDTSVSAFPQPAEPAPRLLAALRPKMLELVRDKADGAHSFFVPPEHTALAREIIGPDRLLVPEQAVILETDPARARRIARAHTTFYLTLPNYLNNLRDLGYDDRDFADGGSDRLVDAIVAWGDAETVARRLQSHLDAGADHIALQPLTEDDSDFPAAVTALRELAPVLAL
ncbi:TIGR03620 family F420-dependent LLM class oxidoreductase [Nonomuraea sp. NPDC046570]|uniref:TIGR03620 family F420-dependent LLM class oxidoreductase n=1 Tax=Nonomuraea sp. NPDC046570 TaxID=3155255 RepID=UPI00340634BE